MEKLNEAKVVEDLIIDEESYQQIKKDLCKTDDCFSTKELMYFNAIFNATPR